MTYTKLVVIVDDEELTLKSSKRCLQGNGITNLALISDSLAVLPFLESNPVSVLVLDLNMPKLSGLELLPRIIEKYPYIPVIFMTASDEISNVIECMKAGAFDYLVKPVESSRFVATVKKALELCDMSHELSLLKQQLLSGSLENPSAFSAIIFRNRRMKALLQYIEVVAPTRQPIMISGETGTGKELIARAIHDVSGCRGEFVAVNVAGLDDNMFSDTLFGHKKGAFTGAELAREGLIAKAAGGTLFLDEIGDLSETSQIKLLRLMQEKEYYQVGSDIVKKSDARILLASNKDLPEQIKQGKFRNDLYYRLRAHQVNIPPLRDRIDDLPILFEHFLECAVKTFSKPKPTVSLQQMTAFSHYDFPGNIRELEAIVFDAVARHQTGDITIDIPGQWQSGEPSDQGVVVDPGNPFVKIFGKFPTLEQVEGYMIEEAMKVTAGNQGMAAHMLGISRQTLNKRVGEKVKA
ncbi:MAG: sigma-54-dependent Fis family transcriptional regulator [Geobacteraceae bacterium]|nr:sigma-54-dependent Fis family transcriptional regulator [Geobacteraceae bacterium]